MTTQARVSLICPHCDRLHEIPGVDPGLGRPFDWRCPECDRTNHAHEPAMAFAPDDAAVRVIAEWTCDCGHIHRRDQSDYADVEGLRDVE